jgi:hypothetical protein
MPPAGHGMAPKSRLCPDAGCHCPELHPWRQASGGFVTNQFSLFESELVWAMNCVHLEPMLIGQERPLPAVPEPQHTYLS